MFTVLSHCTQNLLRSKCMWRLLPADQSQISLWITLLPTWRMKISHKFQICQLLKSITGFKSRPFLHATLATDCESSWLHLLHWSSFLRYKNTKMISLKKHDISWNMPPCFIPGTTFSWATTQHHGPNTASANVSLCSDCSQSTLWGWSVMTDGNGYFKTATSDKAVTSNSRTAARGIISPTACRQSTSIKLWPYS